MSEKKFWDKIGGNFADEIFSVFASDKCGRLKKLVEKHAGRRKDAIDFGCGIGLEALQFARMGNRVVLADIAPDR